VLPQRTILLAEPEAQLRAAWRSGLDAMGFSVRECGDGTSALLIALRSVIALVITELYLASGTVACLVRAARREPGLKRVKILVITDHSSDEDRAWALTAGADGYLVKPIRLGRMLQIAARLATTRQQSRAEARISYAMERAKQPVDPT
jgi:two-component system, OmpR family, phosphate regulon response regulator PhoB